MKKLAIFILLITTTSCQRTSSETWEDVKTAGRFFKKSVYALWGGGYESRELASEEDFTGPDSEEFIALNENDLQPLQSRSAKTKQTKTSTKKNLSLAQSKSSPNPKDFFSPSDKLSKVFRMINFDTDDHVVYNHDDLVVVANIARYMKKHPNAELIIEGFCDERASADYNIALGMRRANHIRVLLAKQGVPSSRIYTNSYGKEKPISLGHSPYDYQKNRRVEFKVKAK